MFVISAFKWLNSMTANPSSPHTDARCLAPTWRSPRPPRRRGVRRPPRGRGLPRSPRGRDSPAKSLFWSCVGRQPLTHPGCGVMAGTGQFSSRHDAVPVGGSYWWSNSYCWHQPSAQLVPLRYSRYPFATIGTPRYFW